MTRLSAVVTAGQKNRLQRHAAALSQPEDRSVEAGAWVTLGSLGYSADFKKQPFVFSMFPGSFWRGKFLGPRDITQESIRLCLRWTMQFSSKWSPVVHKAGRRSVCSNVPLRGGRDRAVALSLYGHIDYREEFLYR